MGSDNAFPAIEDPPESASDNKQPSALRRHGRASAALPEGYQTIQETDQNRGRSTFRAPMVPPEPPGADHPGTDHAPGGLRRTGC